MKRIFLHNSRLLLCFATLLLFATRSNAQAPYCGASYFQGCGLGCGINDFIVNGETGTSINDAASGCAGGGMGFPGSYYDDKTSMSVTFKQGGTYTLSSNNGTGSGISITPDNIQVWIDFDNNNSFDVGEEIGGGAFTAGGIATNFTLTIPSGAAVGTHRMRACASGSETYPGLNPCPTTTGNPNGETHDYTVVIVASGPTCAPPTLSLGAATCSTQVVNWTAATGATGYEYVRNTSSVAPASGTAIAATPTTATETGLTSGTTYYVHIRTVCGAGVYSSWTSIPFSAGPSAIAGNPAICPGTTTPMSNSTPGGTWSSSNPAAATINATTGIMGGVAAGTTTITYSVGGCNATLAVNVGSMPAITGTTSVCPGSTTTLANPVPGGTWSSSNPSVATVNTTSGVVGGVATGTSVITYSSSGCSATTTVTVSTLPAITGGNSVCVGLTLALSNSTSGGNWTSSAAGTASVSAAGVVTGVATGSATITYTLGGCFVTQAVTVGAAIAPITGTTTFCVTGSTTLATTTTGGTWSSSAPGTAAVSGAGVVSGVSAGTATISYSTGGGCSATQNVTVEPNNGGTISGPDSVCKGLGHEITLVASQPGGTWSSSNTKATVDASGVVTGVTPSSLVTIRYVLTNTCGTYTVTKAVYVRAANKCATAVAPVTEQANILKVFPNPSKGIFTMNLSSDMNEEVHVLVTNMLGQKVSEFTTTTNNSADVRLSPAPGIYLLTATTDHGRYVARVVIE